MEQIDEETATKLAEFVQGKDVLKLRKAVLEELMEQMYSDLSLEVILQDLWFQAEMIDENDLKGQKNNFDTMLGDVQVRYEKGQ
jgi:hypothetical protein